MKIEFPHLDDIKEGDLEYEFGGSKWREITCEEHRDRYDEQGIILNPGLAGYRPDCLGCSHTVDLTIEHAQRWALDQISSQSSFRQSQR